MVRAAYTFLGCLLISVSSYAAPTTLDCQSSTNNFESNVSELEKVAENVDECPPPTKDTFAGVCIAMFQRSEARNPESELGFSYQERLWQMSCAEPGKDSMDVARIKIQKMWNKHRENFRCYNFPNSIATDSNITKFSLDTGFTSFMHEAVRRYKLDMNFVDPADKKTVLDFAKEQEALIRKTPPVNTAKADEYNAIAKLLESNGAKRAKDL